MKCSKADMEEEDALTGDRVTADRLDLTELKLSIRCCRFAEGKRNATKLGYIWCLNERKQSTTEKNVHSYMTTLKAVSFVFSWVFILQLKVYRYDIKQL